jgi:hypothetical protein
MMIITADELGKHKKWSTETRRHTSALGLMRNATQFQNNAPQLNHHRQNELKKEEGKV